MDVLGAGRVLLGVGWAGEGGLAAEARGGDSQTALVMRLGLEDPELCIVE